MNLTFQPQWRDHLKRWLQVMVVVAAAAAVVSLAIERGFHEPHRLIRQQVLHAVQATAVGLFVVWRFVGLWLAPDRRRYMQSHWLDFALIAVGAAVLLVAFELFLAAGTVYVATIQVFLGIQLIVELIRFHVTFSASALPPARLLVLGFLLLIVAGALLLMLPKATTFDHIYSRHPFLHSLNCLFTATSATCVTGLIVYDTQTDFTLFGQVVILAMMQLGGLGIMIFGSVFGVLLGRQLTIRQSMVMQDALAQQTLGEIGRMVKFILTTTLTIEAIGAVALYWMWSQDLGAGQHRWFHAVFHSVSAFCNAGFSLQPDSLVRYRGAWQVYGAIMPLIIIGGLGFPVLHELWQRTTGWLGAGRAGGAKMSPANPDLPARRRHLSLHSKLVLISSTVLILAGAVLLFVGESRSVRASSDGRRTDQMASMPTGQRALSALFQSVTARTAGFNTVSLEPGTLSPGSHFLLCLLMFVGGSPGSTAGGIKTVTVVVMMLAVTATLRRRENIEVFGRTILAQMVRRAAAIITLGLALVSAAVLLLCYSESASLLEVLFEAVSAFGTVGLSTGLTPHLTALGRCVIIALMFAGRIGPLTLLVALAGRERTARYEYPAELVIMG